MQHRSCRLLTAVSSTLVVLAVQHVLPSSAGDGEWQRGHATYFGASEAVSSAYDGVRGKGSFGQLTEASCGYTERPGDVLPFARDAVAAVGDSNADYPGSCGRCYEVRCRSGIVYVSPGEPVRLVGSVAIIGTEEQPSLADIDAQVKDSKGRSWPGNPFSALNVSGVRCWSDDATIVVRIIDSCPCQQQLPSGKTRQQTWCCGGMPHLDLSYWAFERLAHPVFGAMPIDFRPVDCDSGRPVPASPPYVSPKLYADTIGQGWGWNAYSAHSSTLRVPGTAPKGQSATCVNVSPGGGLSFLCRQGYVAGVQPFKDASSVQFWIRSDSPTDDPYQSSTPKGQVPPLKVFVMYDEGAKYCRNEVALNGTEPHSQQGDWFRFHVPVAAFGCDGYVDLDLLDRLDFQATGIRDAQFCLADVRIV